MKLLLVDDHPLVRAGVVAALQSLGAPELILEASDGIAAMDCLAQHPDVDAVLMDLRMAGMAGMALLEQLKRHYPLLPSLVLSSSEDPADVRRVLKAGARGYCPKSASPATLLAALTLVLGGEIYVPPLMAMAPEASPAEPSLSGLTPRQREVLQELCNSKSNKEIARELGMEEKTVKGHVSAIFKALGVVHRLQAVEAARAAGLVSQALSY
ncbi:response regulator transcription factor [Paucibacter sp. TC2R-5]|uniref:response regulator transcription factor n=1 Tax=Paucibacter sp. TC2R-5 TaxID=2893555 RepID=UPI0021E4F720|nr:response regulator transcription factor [Paucibacter sp. TC2R-5]MCV2361670.1 response regulator transcription factor [Paucibacter sp. TC2R-5]